MAAPLLAEPSPHASHSWLWDRAVSQPPRPSDLDLLTRALDTVIAADFAGAQDALGDPGRLLLLAALGPTIARVLGSGAVTVDLDDGSARLRRMRLECGTSPGLTGPESLSRVRHALRNETASGQPADVSLAFRTTAPGPANGAEHRLALQVHHDGNALRCDWWFDTRSLDRNTVRELAEQFPRALVEVTSG